MHRGIRKALSKPPGLRRTDFPERYRTQPKKGPAVEQDVLVLEIAIGLDRCVYNWDLATSL